MSLPMHLMRHDVEIAFARLEAGQEPGFDWRTGPLASITYTSSETSLVCAFDAVPVGVVKQGPLTGFEVAGPLDFTLVGVLSGLLEPLAKRHISVLALSTYDTDWILVDSDRRDDAASLWRRAGHTVAPAHLTGGPIT